MDSFHEYFDGKEYSHFTYSDVEEFKKLDAIERPHVQSLDDWEHIDDCLMRAEDAIITMWANNTLITPEHVRHFHDLIDGEYGPEDIAFMYDEEDNVPLPRPVNGETMRYLKFKPIEWIEKRIQERWRARYRLR